jgi:DNA-binding MurR/RpiR family transcriptional regulator
MMPQNRAFRALPASSLVAERIEAAYPLLTDALRSFADFVLEQPFKVAQLSINETVHASGVSVATANRFARRLGFAGYPQFRAEVIRSFEDVVAPVERLRDNIAGGTDTHALIKQSFEEDIQNLNVTLANLDMRRVEALVERMVSARRIFALGFDQAGALMALFAHRLQMAGLDARTAPAAGGRLGAARELAQFGPEDLVIAIAFPRYIRDTIDLAHEAVARGLPLIAFTDSQASPLAQLAESTVYLQSRRTIGATSDTAILCFLEAIASAVSARKPGSAEAAALFAEVMLPWVVPAPRERN